jgi:hypothetical protein
MRSPAVSPIVPECRPDLDSHAVEF